MNFIAQFRAFADHYQLYVVDGDYDHWSNSDLDWSTGSKTSNGNLATPRAIYISTKAHLNDHRVRIFLGFPEGAYDYMESHQFTLETGTLKIYGPADCQDEHFRAAVQPGQYTLTLCARNLGGDALSGSDEPPDDLLPDDEFFEHDEFEHYDIYLTPA